MEVHDGGPARPDDRRGGSYEGPEGAQGDARPVIRVWGLEPGTEPQAVSSEASYARAYTVHGRVEVPPPPPRKAGRMVPLWGTVAVGATCLALGAGLGVAKSGGSTTSTTAVGAAAAGVPNVQAPPSPVVTTVFVTEEVAAPTTVAPATTSAPSAGTIPGDGTYMVGTDIKPGRYKTTGPAPDSDARDCYWERDRDLDNGLDSIIANDNTQGQTVVQIRPADAAFKTSGCADWVKIG